MAQRLTYKSSMGDYGSAIDWEDRWQEIFALRNKCGKFEDEDWVSVKDEGYPKEDGWYYVTIYDSCYNKRETDMVIFDNQEMFHVGSSNDGTRKVIAWKYPVPYEGE